MIALPFIAFMVILYCGLLLLFILYCIFLRICLLPATGTVYGPCCRCLPFYCAITARSLLFIWLLVGSLYRTTPVALTRALPALCYYLLYRPYHLCAPACHTMLPAHFALLPVSSASFCRACYSSCCILLMICRYCNLYTCYLYFIVVWFWFLTSCPIACRALTQLFVLPIVVPFYCLLPPCLHFPPHICYLTCNM